ncbi:hypothetical protein D0N36_04900 [Hymenobacter lapidiphilus]|nr:hypothetical protein D0N36_04900 [Hymenobacter sp. CCM 8763]
MDRGRLLYKQAWVSRLTHLIALLLKANGRYPACRITAIDLSIKKSLPIMLLKAAFWQRSS